MKKINKKGVLGLDVVGKVIVFGLLLAVIAIAVFLALSSINTTQLFPPTSTTQLNINLTAPGTNLANCVSPTTVTTVFANGVTLPSANYTFTASNCNIINATAAIYQYANVTYSYGSTTYVNVNGVTNNVTSGTTAFFTNLPTIFTILGAVVIILAVALILYAVSRFAGGGGRVEGSSSEL